MNKLISIFVFTIGVALVCSCTDHFPEKVERYISKHNILNDQGKGELDLREALDIDYNTMYVLKTYGDAEDPYTALIGSDSEMCRIIFIKNKRVVYEDDYYYYEYKLNLEFETFRRISGYGIFDGSPIAVYGYICTKHHFTVSRVSDDEYTMR